MVSPDAADFIKYDFATTQDLCKQFITVVSGVLVFSLTFSEKIIDFVNAKRPLRILLGISWAAMLLAIVACGIGLTVVSIAGGQAVYGLGFDHAYKRTATFAYLWIITAGILFLIGLVSLVTLSIVRAFAK